MIQQHRTKLSEPLGISLGEGFEADELHREEATKPNRKGLLNTFHAHLQQRNVALTTAEADLFCVGQPCDVSVRALIACHFIKLMYIFLIAIRVVELEHLVSLIVAFTSPPPLCPGYIVTDHGYIPDQFRGISKHRVRCV